ncbi:MAG: hypothetical protein ACOX6S_01495 [Clostridia bacterium]|jgi:hypothetical protein
MRTRKENRQCLMRLTVAAYLVLVLAFNIVPPSAIDSNLSSIPSRFVLFVNLNGYLCSTSKGYYAFFFIYKEIVDLARLMRWNSRRILNWIGFLASYFLICVKNDLIAGFALLCGFFVFIAGISRATPVIALSIGGHGPPRLQNL